MLRRPWNFAHPTRYDLSFSKNPDVYVPRPSIARRKIVPDLDTLPHDRKAESGRLRDRLIKKGLFMSIAVAVTLNSTLSSAVLQSRPMDRFMDSWNGDVGYSRAV